MAAESKEPLTGEVCLTAPRWIPGESFHFHRSGQPDHDPAMTTRGRIFSLAASAVLLGGCGKKESPGVPGSAPGENVAAVVAPPPVATHLGIATRVPADADLFFAGYGADRMIGGVIRRVLESDVVSKISEGEEAEEKLREAEDVPKYAGDEAFVFVGPGVGVQLETVGRSYRELSAAWIGFAAGSLLDTLAKKDGESGLSGLEDSLSEDLLGKWMDAVEKDERLQLPSVVMGWRPHAEKEAECRDAVTKGLEAMLAGKSQVAPVAFEVSGVAMKGHEFSGREMFGELVTKAREELQKQGSSAEALEKISPERIERLLAAMEKVRLTIASGSLDGRIVIYIGNGAEGFRLAETPDKSLAATDDLKWTHGHAEQRIAGVAYLSEPMVRAALPWLDTSDYWLSLSRAIRPPVREERLLRELLAAMADTSRELAQRDASAWSAVVVEDQGWRYESRGGWADPALDYAAPLRMTDAAISLKPAVRMHWVQHRGRNDLSWKQVEQLGVLAESIFNEFGAADPSVTAMVPDGAFPRMMKEMRELNRAYRDEFHAGIGDEVAFVMDMQGEVPPLPGISEETVAAARMPRFIVARPVTDHAKIDASGASFAASWKGLTGWASELSGSEVPLILPQKIESSDLVTWYPPLPFIGGDFIPGVTMSDSLWMLGTSKSMAAGFSKAMAAPSSASEAGMIVEIDFSPIRDWLAELYQRNEMEVEELVGDSPVSMEGLTAENLEEAAAGFRQWQGLSYRKWLADGKPGTSLHLRIAAAE